MQSLHAEGSSELIAVWTDGVINMCSGALNMGTTIQLQ
jgi:hypothetical protein